MESIKWYTSSKSKEWDFVYFAVLFTCGENSAISHLIITDDRFLLEIEEKIDSDHRFFVENKYKALNRQMRREGGEDRKTSFNVMLFPYVLVPTVPWRAESKSLQTWHQRYPT